VDWSFGNIAPDSHPPEAAIAPGIVIGGRYQVVESLGSGAQGEVLRAVDLQLNRPVAIKLLKLHSDTPRERFLREGRLTAALTHPNVVSLHAGGITESGRPFLVLELLDKPVPLDVYAREQPLEVRMRLFVDVCRGVGAAHAAGIAHRDLKPSNLLVDRAGEVRVCDFGLGVHRDDDSRLTQSSSVIGTPLYMSPEALFDGKRHRGPRQDVWSLGVVLYQLLTDELPFMGGTLTELYARIVSGVKPPSTVRSVVPDLERVCLRCLKQDPQERFPDAGSLGAAVQAVVLGPLRPKGLIPAGLLAGVGVSALVWVLIARGAPAPFRPSPVPPPPPALPDDSPLGSYRFPASDAEYVSQLERAVADEDLEALRPMVAAGLERGQPDAYHVQGVIHREGWDGEVDLPAALECFRRAARGGSVNGIFSLGLAYEEGRGVEPDLPEALRLYQRAANLGSAPAHLRLGLHFLKGTGVERNLARAEKHLLAAAEEQPAATFQLSALYYEQKRIVEGGRWMQRAAEQGYPRAMYEQGVALLEEGDVEGGLDWLNRSAELGYDQSQVRLASIYLDGEVVPKNEALALSWVRRAAEHSALGQYNLGVFYERGYGLEPDPVRAKELFEASAERGYVTAMLKCFHVYLEGRGCEPNAIAAHRWLRKAVEAKSLSGMSLLAKRTMLGVTPSSSVLTEEERHERALPLLRRVHQNKSTPESAYELGVCLVRMKRVGEALPLLRRAAVERHEAAYTTLGDVLTWPGDYQDYDEALRWYRAGLDGDKPYAALAIGRLLEGEFDPALTDLPGAREAFERAVALGSRGGMYRLAKLLADERAGPVDLTRGRELLQRALREEQADPKPDPSFVEAIEERLADYPPG